MSATDPMVLASTGGVPQHPSPEQVAAWFCERALVLDSFTGQLQHAATLLEAAVQRGVQGGVPLLLNQVGRERGLRVGEEGRGEQVCLRVVGVGGECHTILSAS